VALIGMNQVAVLIPYLAFRNHGGTALNYWVDTTRSMIKRPSNTQHNEGPFQPSPPLGSEAEMFKLWSNEAMEINVLVSDYLKKMHRNFVPVGIPVSLKTQEELDEEEHKRRKKEKKKKKKAKEAKKLTKDKKPKKDEGAGVAAPAASAAPTASAAATSARARVHGRGGTNTIAEGDEDEEEEDSDDDQAEAPPPKRKSSILGGLVRRLSGTMKLG
jgi:hypothetical protein